MKETEKKTKKNCTIYIGKQKLFLGCPEIEVKESKNSHHLCLTFSEPCFVEEFEIAQRDQNHIQVELVTVKDEKFQQAAWGFYQVEMIIRKRDSLFVLLRFSTLSLSWIQEFSKVLEVSYLDLMATIAATLEVPPNQLESYLATRKNIPLSAVLGLGELFSIALSRGGIDYKGVLSFKTVQVASTFYGKRIYTEIAVDLRLDKDLSSSRSVPLFKVLVPPPNTTTRNPYDYPKLYSYPVICNYVPTKFFQLQHCVCKEQSDFINYIIAVTSKPQLDKALRILQGRS